jgi:hypothetical protein
LLIFAVEKSFAQAPHPKWLPEGWYRLGVCETGLNWRMVGSTYSGAFGFYNGTWVAFGGLRYASYAGLASPRQQLLIARRVASRVGLSAWGCYTRADSLGAWVRAGFGR